MASKVYPKAKEAALSGLIDLPAATVKAVLIDAGTYSYSDTHEFYSSVSGEVGTAVTLAGKTVTDGVFDANDITFTSVSGNSAEAIIIYIDTGSAATSRLLAYIDSGTGLPVTPNGTDIQCQWSNGSFKIFAL